MAVDGDSRSSADGLPRLVSSRALGTGGRTGSIRGSLGGWPGLGTGRSRRICERTGAASDRDAASYPPDVLNDDGLALIDHLALTEYEVAITAETQEIRYRLNRELYWRAVDGSAEGIAFLDPFRRLPLSLGFLAQQGQNSSAAGGAYSPDDFPRSLQSPPTPKAVERLPTSSQCPRNFRSVPELRLACPWP